MNEQTEIRDTLTDFDRRESALRARLAAINADALPPRLAQWPVFIGNRALYLHELLEFVREKETNAGLGKRGHVITLNSGQPFTDRLHAGQLAEQMIRCGAAFAFRQTRGGYPEFAFEHEQDCRTAACYMESRAHKDTFRVS